LSLIHHRYALKIILQLRNKGFRFIRGITVNKFTFFFIENHFVEHLCRNLNPVFSGNPLVAFINTIIAVFINKKDLLTIKKISAVAHVPARRAPWWIIAVHLGFVTLTVLSVHHPSFVLGLFIFFLGFYAIDIPNHHFDWYLARYNLEMHSKIHGTYMCLWIGIALLFLVDYSLGYKKYSTLLKFALICMFASLLSGLIIYNSRNIILGLVLVSFLLILIVKKQKNVIPFSIKIAIGCSIVLVILFSQRYIDAFRFFSTDSYTNSTRYASWS
jgi:hypothetical protein